MCGIVGYVGNTSAVEVLLDGLKKLEYRGYDSAGVAVRNAAGSFTVLKEKGRLVNLENCIAKHNPSGTEGIGHTRWATHGESTRINAHPHYSADDRVVGVHNGIIENFKEIKQELSEKGYTFYSETDTEVCIKLIDYYYADKKDPLEALKAAKEHIRGSYALAILFADRPGEIWVMRKNSPMILGVKEGASFLASDVPAILKHTRDVYYMEDDQIAQLTRKGITFFDAEGHCITMPKQHIDWDVAAAEKGGYAHFMLKEIHEQPVVIANALRHFVEPNGWIRFDGANLTPAFYDSFDRIHIVACGSAYHVACVSKYIVESLARIPVETDIASEFRYRHPILSKRDLVVVISQSGETADSLAALREAQEMGASTLAIVNVVGSSIAREAQRVIYTVAGPEIAVATTKAYSCQLLVMDLFALDLALHHKRIREEDAQELIGALKTLPRKMDEILREEEAYSKVAERFLNKEHMFFVGRGMDYAGCLEASLKLKEVSYLHSEAYAAGELKHGTISLIEEGTPVIGIATQADLMEKTRSNLLEVKTRGGDVTTLIMEGMEGFEDVGHVMTIPEIHPLWANSLSVLPMQLLAYYESTLRGLDVDKPRNLAKSVTVE
ncbi:glutamine--fructose-6-phosphate transaminase (isomerizing) [uncultured Murdochiella sp.]|uniref:glutamine--fructose-6-phosphate transaminase (isomerizing) n=1 Tax=uncultured Murdochiella sp. TaxID=1586095 RepID=UPI00280656D1|nr:glutamine--fructose-6-phosphate transaminase (isomerizing) [uncultured Murdochiella sp.]